MTVIDRRRVQFAHVETHNVREPLHVETHNVREPLESALHVHCKALVLHINILVDLLPGTETKVYPQYPNQVDQHKTNCHIYRYRMCIYT